jgi:hypothetical protein
VANVKAAVMVTMVTILTAVNISSQETLRAGERTKHRFLVHDEGNAGLAYIDQFDSTKNWKYSNGGQTYWGLQLVGNNRVLLGTSNEVNILTGKEEKPRVQTGGNPSAIRLENGNTLRCYESGSRVIEEFDSTGKQLRKKIFTGMSVLRMATYTPDQTFLFASNHSVDEVDWNGNIVWHFGDPDSMKTGNNQHICRALRMPNGNTLISTGYGARLIVVSKDKKIRKVIGGKNQPGNDSIKSNYYAGFHVLSNGHYIVTNWQAHGPGHGNEGVQILEYDTSGALVWSYKNPSMYSSVQDIIILDSLDITKFHDERSGVIAPLAITAIFNKYQGEATGSTKLNSIDLSEMITSFSIDGKIVYRNGIVNYDQRHQGRILIIKDNSSYSKMIFCR